MKSQLIPAFEKEFKCKVEVDSAFPFLPKLQASPRAPVYDVLHTNSNEQWAAHEGIVEAKIDAKQVPNIADVYPYAVSDKMVGVAFSPAPSASAIAPTRATASRRPGRTSPTPMTACVAAMSFR